jgi:protein-S-isoprenylcysteine O-methyltransferase Ste14
MPSWRQVAVESWQRFGEYLPEMRRPWSVALVWGGFICAQGVALGLALVVARAVPYGAVLAQGFFIVWSGVWMYGGFWRHRVAYRRRYAEQAYRRLFFRFLFPAAIGAATAMIFPAFVAGKPLLPPIVAYSIAAYLLVSMELLGLRGAELFWNFDLRAFVYSVFPERGRPLTAGIFQWLRHPIYSAAARMTLGLAALRNDRAAFLCAGLIAAAVRLWAAIEERALEERDPQYVVYRRRVPAFWVRDPLRFWRYLLTGHSTTDAAERSCPP